MRPTLSFVLGMLVLAIMGSPMPARALELAGTAWVFSGSKDYERSNKEDVHDELRGRGPGRLAGSSCCERFVVAFPTSDSFSLRHNGYVIGTGSVRQMRKSVALAPDGTSMGTLLWWLENFVEFQWNASPFDLDLNLWLTTMKQESIAITVKTVGGETSGTLKLVFRFRGDVRGFDPARVRRFSTGPATGKALFREQSEGVMSLAELEEYDAASPLPAVRPCDGEDDFGDLGASRGWPHPDYCRR